MNAIDAEFVRIHEQDGARIPIVSLRHMVTREEVRKPALARALGNVCREFGFFYVEDHGVPGTLLTLAEQAVHEFFALPMSEKMKIYIALSPYHRGYGPPGEENAYGATAKDIKEVFDMALELPLDDEDVRAGKFFHGPNAWPVHPSHFKPTMLWLYREWQRVCENISELFAMALDLPPGFFVERSQKPLAQMRASRYPVQPVVAPAGSIGCGAHTDYGIVSIIWQMDVPGLEIEDMQGRWFSAPRIPGTFVCPMGDATGIWTNGYWRPTPHRVVNTSGVERHSLSFFYDQDHDCLMAPLPRFVSADRPSRYAPTTMGAHVARGFNGTFEYRNKDTSEGVAV